MSLSLCMITDDPAPRVAEVLEHLRPLADEVVLAADARVDAERLASYATLADRLFTIEFRLYERHLAWLHSQCSSEWILRIDGDELPSRAFLDRLPELLECRDILQYWIRRAWVYPDVDHVLDKLPWSVDFVNRLVRNDASLRFSGDQHLHATLVSPAAYIEEPIYHLELLVADEDARRAKAIRHEVARPHVVAPGGGRLNEAFYLPELHRTLRFSGTPTVDRQALTRARGLGTEVRKGVASSVRHVSLGESQALWDGRPLAPSAYRAVIEVLKSEVVAVPGERRLVLVAVTNEGTDRWPGGMDTKPAICLSYRWRRGDRSLCGPEGLRSPFPGPVAPGARVLVPLDVMVPLERGDLVLEVDVVHEDVRWFERPCAIPIRVGAPAELPPVGARLRETARRRRWPPQRLTIPRIIHRVWLGSSPMPRDQQLMGESFRTRHRRWRHRLWGERDLAALGIGEQERRAARTASELSNLVRYEVLHRFGGVYVDTDVECRRRLTPLLRGLNAFAALEAPGRVGTAVLGAVPGHHAFARAAAEARRTLGIGAHSADASGPYFLTLLLEQCPDVAILGGDIFYPYSWDEPERASDPFPDAYAIHHWVHSWRGDGRR